jgi:hypothetical protein
VPENFDTRKAALNHAGLAFPKERDVNEAVNAIACGLVYVGDRLADMVEEQAVIVKLLEQLDATISNGLSSVAAELR